MNTPRWFNNNEFNQTEVRLACDLLGWTPICKYLNHFYFYNDTWDSIFGPFNTMDECFKALRTHIKEQP